MTNHGGAAVNGAETDPLSDTARQVADLILLTLRAHKISQRWLADEIGYTQKHVSGVLTGHVKNSLPALRRMSAALGYDWLVVLVPSDYDGTLPDKARPPRRDA
jgi:transcriptional regulator with XRE-family HTH domain